MLCGSNDRIEQEILLMVRPCPAYLGDAGFTIKIINRQVQILQITAAMGYEKVKDTISVDQSSPPETKRKHILFCAI